MSIRTERLAAVIQRDIGNILQQSYQTSGSFITVTQVNVTQDLMIAKVHISVYAPAKDEDAIFERLQAHSSNIRKELAGKIRHQVRRIPELEFYKDTSAEYAEHMEKLFSKIRKKREENTSQEG